MGYTLASTWFLLAVAALIGVAIGWLLRKKFCPCDDSALRAELNAVKSEASEHKAKVQGLIGQLDTHKSEAARLKASSGDVLKHTQRIDELEAAAAGAATAASAATLAAKIKHDDEVNALKAELMAATTKHAEAEQKIQSFAASGSAASVGSAPSADSVETAKLSARIAELESDHAKAIAAAAAAATAAAGAAAFSSMKHAEEVTALKTQLSELQAKNPEAIQSFTAASSAPVPSSAPTSPPESDPSTLSAEQLKGGASILELPSLEMDDLKVVDGIGAKIDELLVASGISTWRQLENTSLERLQTILDAGGPNFGGATPATWSHQAGLLADGRWAEFKTFTNGLNQN